MANTKIPVELSSTPGIVDNSNATAITIDSSENVGIGTASPTGKLGIYGGGISDIPLVITHAWGSSSTALISASNSSSEVFKVERSGNVTLKGNDLNLNNGSVEHRFTNDNTNLLIRADYGNSAASSTIQFSVDGSEKMRIDSSGNVGIGTSSPSAALETFGGTSFIGAKFKGYTGGKTALVGGDTGAVWFGDDDGSIGTTNNFNIIGASNVARIVTNSSERMRIDGSGNLLVGTTSSNFGVAGSQLGVGGNNYMTRSGANPLLLNRLSSDGAILSLAKDGTTVGSINVGAGNVLAIGQGSNYIQFHNSLNSFYASDGNGGRDNAMDIGTSSVRFDDIYATNGTIQTSDRNEKQDIAELSDAETRVAVAAKGLLRKFRWQSAVEEKGDEARIHFGIIAQDLQDAFTAEGLDAGDYAMFISSTWTDDDGVEQTRLGVRYSELLAFIIAAI